MLAMVKTAAFCSLSYKYYFCLSLMKVEFFKILAALSMHKIKYICSSQMQNPIVVI